MLNPMDYINTTSATQAFEKASSVTQGLASTFQQGAGSIQAGVSSFATDLSKAGVSIVNAIEGGVKSVTDKFKSELANLSKPPAAPAVAPQEVMAAKRDVGNYVFPSDIGDYFVMFSFYEYVRPAATEISKKRFTSTFAFPLPAQLTESFLMQYEQIDMGQIAATVQNVGGGKDMQGLITTTEGLKELGKAALPSAVQSNFAARARSTAGAGIARDAVNATKQSGGFAPNPHIGLLFKGVNIRAPHTFVYRFSPKTPPESRELREMIRQLKVRMHPSLGVGQLNFNYPDLCDITIKRPIGESGPLYVFKTCFLESMNVNYAPNGVPTFFMDTRDPTDIEVTMIFKEAEIFTRSDFQTEVEKTSAPSDTKGT